MRRLAGRPQHDLNSFERKVSSQNGEDGIIEALFSAIGTTNKTVVEFGVEDGQECNSARLIRDCGWNGVLIEADEARYRQLVANYAAFPQARLANRFITKDNIADIFREHAVPAEPDLLSIDLDGNDYWIWQALDAYRPRVVVIEFNSAHAPPERWVMEYDADHRWRGDDYFGASLESLAALGRAKGYALLCTDSLGVNAFFLRRDLLGVSGYPERTARQAFHPPGFMGSTGTRGHPAGSGPFRRI